MYMWAAWHYVHVVYGGPGLVVSTGTGREIAVTHGVLMETICGIEGSFAASQSLINLPVSEGMEVILLKCGLGWAWEQQAN